MHTEVSQGRNQVLSLSLSLSSCCLAVPCPCCSRIAAHTRTVCPTTGFKITNPALSREIQAICLYCTDSGLLPHPLLAPFFLFHNCKCVHKCLGPMVFSQPATQSSVVAAAPCWCLQELLVLLGTLRHQSSGSLQAQQEVAEPLSLLRDSLPRCTDFSPPQLSFLPSFHLSPLSKSIQGSSSNIPGRRISEGPL